MSQSQQDIPRLNMGQNYATIMMDKLLKNQSLLEILALLFLCPTSLKLCLFGKLNLKRTIKRILTKWLNY